MEFKLDSEFLDFYKWGVYNHIILPAEGDDLLTLTEIILKRYARKAYLTFSYFSEYNIVKHNIYVKLQKQMLNEEKQINYWITIVNQVIRNKQLCYDVRYIIIQYLV